MAAALRKFPCAFVPNMPGLRQRDILLRPKSPPIGLVPNGRGLGPSGRGASDGPALRGRSARC